MSSIQHISQKGIDFIKGFETCKLKAYKIGNDAVTIGWGNTFYENGQPIQLGQTITQERANQLFLNILASFEKGVSQLVTSNINQNQFDSLVSFAYNVGLDIDSDTIAEGLGDSTLLKKVNSNPNDPTIRNEFMKWVNKGTIFEQGLTRRRKGEADIYFFK
jgi:lysozyme